MSTFISASICLTDLLAKANEGHSSFTRAGQKNKVYCNLKIWINDEADKYGNTVSLQLNSSKEKFETEGKFYIGNGKVMTSGIGEPIAPGQFDTKTIDDLPF